MAVESITVLAFIALVLSAYKSITLYLLDMSEFTDVQLNQYAELLKYWNFCTISSLIIFAILVSILYVSG